MTPLIVVTVLMMTTVVSDSPYGTLSGQAAGGGWGCGGGTYNEGICGSEGLCDEGFVCTNDHCVLPEVARILESYWTWDPFKPPKPRYLRDEQGRAIILHGLNVDGSAKSHGHSKHLTQARAERQVKKWGFNGVRYITNWRWIEPKRGSYDEKFLDEMEKRVQWYGDLGAWVFLDMHQDLYGPAVGGNGAPAWATQTDGNPPLNVDYGQFWWLKNLSPDIIAAYENFWDYPGDHPYLQEAYLDVWRHVVKRFRDNPAVIGYDLMNEPHAGNLQKATGLGAMLGMDGEFEPKELIQLYRRLIPAIRELDPDTWIFFEPQAFGVNFGIHSDLPTVRDARKGGNRLVYAPHIYPFFLHEGVAYERFDREQVASWAVNRTAETRKHNSVLHVGEIGASDKTEGALLYFEEAMSLLDYMGAGWSLWAGDPSPWGPTNTAYKENPKMDILVRTYPQKVAGDPISFSYQHSSKAFKLVYKERSGVTGPTEIFIPASRHYPGGWAVTFSDGDEDENWTQEWDEDRQVLRLWYTGDKKRHTIRIKRTP